MDRLLECSLLCMRMQSCVCVCLVLEMMLDMFAVFKLNTIHIFG